MKRYPSWILQIVFGILGATSFHPTPFAHASAEDLPAELAPSTSGDPCIDAYRKFHATLAEVAAQKIAKAREEFTEEYSFFREIGPEENQAFKARVPGVQSAAKAEIPNQEVSISDAEIAVLKELNDKITENKALATALTNYYKHLLHSKVTSDPLIHDGLTVRYNDFKSLRFIHEGDASVFKSQMAKHYEAARDEYVKKVEELGLGPELEKAHGLAAQPMNWNLSGIAEEDADFAIATSRRARTLAGNPEEQRIPLQTFEEVRPLLDHSFEKGARLRQTLQTKLEQGSGAKLLVPAYPGSSSLIPTAKVIEKIRKLSPPQPFTEEAYIEAIQRMLVRKFNALLQPDEVQDLLHYLRESDPFIAGLMLDERVETPYHLAKHGFLSVDFEGQNSRNIHSGLRALAKAEEVAKLTGVYDSRLAIKLNRLAEREATRILDENKKRVSQSAQEVLEPDESNSFFFSGDDGNFFPADAEITHYEKVELWKNYLARSQYRELRPVHFPEKDAAGQFIPTDEAQQYNLQAELFAKNLKDQIEDQIGVDQMDGFFLVMNPTIRPLPEIAGAVSPIQKMDIFVAGTINPTHKDIIEGRLRILCRMKGIEPGSVEYISPPELP